MTSFQDHLSLTYQCLCIVGSWICHCLMQLTYLKLICYSIPTLTWLVSHAAQNAVSLGAKGLAALPQAFRDEDYHLAGGQTTIVILVSVGACQQVWAVADFRVNNAILCAVFTQLIRYSLHSLTIPTVSPTM